MIDKVLIEIDRALKTLTLEPTEKRVRPDASIQENSSLPTPNKKINAQYMRVNHSGEICAQGLYRGQLFFNRNTLIKTELEKAADEEADHLAWCNKRIEELGGKTSKLNPVLYASSFIIGAFNSFVDEKSNLGFLAETEKQVALHLTRHLDRVDKNDIKTIHILKAMKADEEGHESSAIAMGAKELNPLTKKIMGKVSKLMTKTTFYI